MREVMKWNNYLYHSSHKQKGPPILYLKICFYSIKPYPVSLWMVSCIKKIIDKYLLRSLFCLWELSVLIFFCILPKAIKLRHKNLIENRKPLNQGEPKHSSPPQISNGCILLLTRLFDYCPWEVSLSPFTNY